MSKLKKVAGRVALLKDLVTKFTQDVYGVSSVINTMTIIAPPAS